MMTFYAAAGRYRIKNTDGHAVPYIQKLGKLHPVSIPEFVIWSTLLWEVMTYDELKHQYEESIRGFDVRFPAFDELLELLLKRKLLVRRPKEKLFRRGGNSRYRSLSKASHGIRKPCAKHHCSK